MEPEAMAALADIAGAVPSDQAVLEVGVHHAANLVNMALAAKRGNGARVFGCDSYGQGDVYRGRPHMLQRYTSSDHQIATQHIKDNRLVRQCKIIVASSPDAAAHWTGPAIGLLVIDAEHRYDRVLSDLHAWTPHLAPDATIAFDDYGGSVGADVKRAVDELAADGTLTIKHVAGTRLAITRLAADENATDDDA